MDRVGLAPSTPCALAQRRHGPRCTAPRRHAPPPVPHSATMPPLPPPCPPPCPPPMRRTATPCISSATPSISSVAPCTAQHPPPPPLTVREGSVADQPCEATYRMSTEEGGRRVACKKGWVGSDEGGEDDVARRALCTSPPQHSAPHHLPRKTARHTNPPPQVARHRPATHLPMRGSGRFDTTRRASPSASTRRRGDVASGRIHGSVERDLLWRGRG
jgi:hypothetical protein